MIQASEIEGMVSKTVAEFGRLDYGVNAAGMFHDTFGLRVLECPLFCGGTLLQYWDLVMLILGG